MPYISSIERTGEARGEIKGEAKEALKLVSLLLSRQLREIPESIDETIKGLSISQLEQLALDLSDFQTIQDLTNWLEQFSKAN